MKKLNVFKLACMVIRTPENSRNIRYRSDDEKNIDWQIYKL